MPFMVLAWPERRDLARGELLVCRVQRQSWWKEQSRIFPEALFFFFSSWPHERIPGVGVAKWRSF